MAVQNFETSLAALEKIVRDLESGDLPLEKSLELFETGVKLSRDCQERLNQAERRIEILMRDVEGNPQIETLDTKNPQIERPEPKVKRRIVFSDDDEKESVF
jgi:exodeoxyribonuclease VII small subunit